jgi:hypothetical protein
MSILIVVSGSLHAMDQVSNKLTEESKVDKKNLDEALMRAVRDNKKEEVKSLLQDKADPNTTDEDLVSPLITACTRYEPIPRIVELLLAAGAHINHMDIDGRTPLFCAQKSAADSSNYPNTYRNIVCVLEQAGGIAHKNQVLMNPEGQVVKIFPILAIPFSSYHEQILPIAGDELGKLKEGWKLVLPLLED